MTGLVAYCTLPRLLLMRLLLVMVMLGLGLGLGLGLLVETNQRRYFLLSESESA